MRRNTLFALLFLIIFGTALRLYQMGFQGLQCDEAYTLMVAQKPFVDLIYHSLFTDCNPPLFYIFAHFSLVLFGFVPEMIRLPSVLFGVLTIPAMYILGSTLRFETNKTDGEIVGLLAAGFMTILFPMVYYSQFARSYAMMIFASTLFFSFFIYIRRTTRSEVPDLNAPTDDYYLLGFLGAVCIWVHLFAIIPVGVTLLSLFVTTRQKDACVAGLTAFIFSLPLAPLFLVTNSERALQSLTWGMGIHDLLVYVAIEFFNLAFPVFLLLIVYGIYREQKDKLVIELCGIVFLTFILGLVASLVTPVFPRYFYTILPVLLVLAAVACSDLIGRIKKENMKPLIVGGFFVLIFLMQWGSLVVHYTIVRLSC